MNSDEHAYLSNPEFNLQVGFEVTTEHVLKAVAASNQVLDALPQTLFTTIDLKSQSGMVGAIFTAELALVTGGLVNPIEKGHPDIVPGKAAEATEEQLRNYPQGLEVKCTLGGIPKGIKRPAGEQRIDVLTGLTWQAHHRDVKELMALSWDCVGGTKGDLAKPVVTAVFFADNLTQDDWGQISGTTGRNTKVTGMTQSGRRKLGDGVVAVIDRDAYLDKYRAKVGGSGFDCLRASIA